MNDDPGQDAPVDDATTWRRRAVPQAGVSILQNPDWASLENIQADRGVVYQRFGAAHGMVFVSYGPDATPDWQLAHTGDARTTRTIESDATVEFLGASARRVRLRLHPNPVRAGGHRRGPAGPEALPAVEPEVFVFVGFTRRCGPVLVGYRVAQSELAAFELLLERVLHSVRAL
jgi:hypothetical protein